MGGIFTRYWYAANSGPRVFLHKSKGESATDLYL